MIVTICYVFNEEIVIGALGARGSPDGTFTYEAIIGRRRGRSGLQRQYGVPVVLSSLATDFPVCAVLRERIDAGCAGRMTIVRGIVPSLRPTG
jgi:hypothetical protein